MGSIFGFIVLCALLYFCCLQTVDDTSETGYDPETGVPDREKPIPSPVRVERRGGALQESKPRRKKKPIMNRARTSSHNRPEYDQYMVDD